MTVIVLNPNEGQDHVALLKRVVFEDSAGPLLLDMSRVSFLKPTTLCILYAVFKQHSTLFPTEKRECIPPTFKNSELDVLQYVKRMNFFKCCVEFQELSKEQFRRFDSQGRFVPITEVNSQESRTQTAEEIAKVIFLKGDKEGESDLKAAFEELVNNSLQHSFSKSGCVIQGQPYANDFAECVIADCGIGIRNSLRRNSMIPREKLQTDESAILQALIPFVSGAQNRPIGEETKYTQDYNNQGLGLSICKEMAIRSGGYLEIISGNVCLHVTSEGITQVPIAGWSGTIVVFHPNYTKLQKQRQIVKEFEASLSKGYGAASTTISSDEFV